MTILRVARFENRAEAEYVRERLAQAGIAAEIHDELGIARLWFVSRWQAGVRLEVPAQDAERTDRFLREWDSSSPRHAIRCPECKSFRIDFPQFTPKSLFTNLAMGLMAELGLIERQYYCEDCHCMWAKPGSHRTRVRHHMAPDYFLEDFPATAPAGRRPLRSQAGLVFHRRKHAAEDERRRRRSLWYGSGSHSRLKVLSVSIPLSGSILLWGAGPSLPAAETQRPADTRLAAAGPGDDTGKLDVRAPGKAPASSNDPTYLRDVLPILMGKCARCHNDQTHILANWLDYDSAASKRWEIKRRIWDSWRGSYFKQPMPTANSPEAGAMTDAERKTIRDWVVHGAPQGVAVVHAGLLSKSEKIELGSRLFATICAACHQTTGLGIPGRFPPLAGSDFLNSDKHRAIKVVIKGLQGEVVVNGRKFNNAMPRFLLSDQDIASALTYVYSSFGNSGKEVTPEEVSAVRVERDEPGANGQMQSAKASQEKSPFE